MTQGRNRSDLSGIRDVLDGFSGSIGLWARNLQTGETLGHLEDEVFEGASTIKVAVMVEAFRQQAAGELGLDRMLRLRQDHWVRGSGVLRDMTPGTELSVRDTIVLMMTISDNVATNMMLDLLGVERVNGMLAACGLGDTRVMGLFDFAAHPPEYGVSRVTARQLGTLVERLALGTAVSPEADAEMLAIMRRQHDSTSVLRYLPPALLDESGGKDPILRVAAKSGSWPGTRNMVALFEGPDTRYVICLVTKDCADRRAGVDNEAAIALPKVSRWVFDRFAAPALRQAATED